MRRLALMAFTAFLLSGCATESVVMTLPPPDGSTPEPTGSRSKGAHSRPVDSLSLHELQTQLSMNRPPDDLGYAEKNFDGCHVGFKNDQGVCGRRFLSVLNFKLVCRDTVGTTSRVPSSLMPLSNHTMQWRFGGQSGNLTTDSLGYGQVQMVSSRPVSTDRFMLLIGTKTLGVEAAEVSQIVLPGNWCPNSGVR